MPRETAYLLSLAAAILAGAACLLWRTRQAGLPQGQRLHLLLLSITLPLVLARLTYFLARVAYLLPMYGWRRLFIAPVTELAFGGAVLGLVLAGWLSARGHKPHQTLDLLTLPALLTLCLARLGEYFVDFGQGSYVAETALQFFPLAVANQWGEWYFAVFMLEAAAALLIGLDSLRPAPRAGARWQRALLMVLLSQIFCESLRADTLRWGFVKVHQLLCAIGLAALLISYLRWLPRAWPWYALGFTAAIAAIIGIEFALDKWLQMPNPVLYLVFCLVLIGLWLLMRRAANQADRPLYGGRPLGKA